MAKQQAPQQYNSQSLPAVGAFTDLHRLVQLRFVARDLKLAPNEESRASLSGPVRTRFRGRGMEFEEVRVYQPGDDIRTIDWRVTARTQTPHTKLFREERERPTFISVDQRASLFFGSQRCFKSVLAAHIATILGWAALAQGDRVGGLVFGDTEHRDIRPRRSKHAVLDLVHQLHQFNHLLNSPISSANSISLATIIQDTQRLAKPGSAIYLISDFHDLDSQCEELLYQLTRRCDLTMLFIHDPLETALPHQQLAVTDGKHRLQLQPGIIFNQHYREQFQQRQQHLLTIANQLKIALYEFSTAGVPIDEVSQLRKIYGRQR